MCDERLEVWKAIVKRLYAPEMYEKIGRVRVEQPTSPLTVVSIALDFVTELEMSGIATTFTNSTGSRLPETATALRIIGCTDDSELLQLMIREATVAGFTYNAAQADMEAADVRKWEITSFSRMHGEKWDNVTARLEELANGFAIERIYSSVEEYAYKHLDELRNAMGMSTSNPQ